MLINNFVAFLHVLMNSMYNIKLDFACIFAYNIFMICSTSLAFNDTSLGQEITE